MKNHFSEFWFALFIIFPGLMLGQIKFKPCNCDLEERNIDTYNRFVCLVAHEKFSVAVAEYQGKLLKDKIDMPVVVSLLLKANISQQDYLNDIDAGFYTSLRQYDAIIYYAQAKSRFDSATTLGYESIFPIIGKETNLFRYDLNCLNAAVDRTKENIFGNILEPNTELPKDSIATIVLEAISKISKTDTLIKIVEVMVEKPSIDIKDFTTNVYFRFDKFELDSIALDSLDSFVKYYNKNCDDCKVVIQGFTDDYGSIKYNQELSENRAKTVRLYLKDHGIPDTVVQMEAFGKLGSGENNKRKVELILYRNK
jgi:outer membrane protein OmpA-like peptidoglycan-associated protein